MDTRETQPLEQPFEEIPASQPRNEVLFPDNDGVLGESPKKVGFDKKVAPYSCLWVNIPEDKPIRTSK